MTLTDFIEKVENIPLQEICKNSVEFNKEEIINVLQYQLFEQSLDGDGNPLRSPYSSQIGLYGNGKSYKQVKEEMRGKEITDLYFTGEMFAEMNMNVTDTEYHITSFVPYTEKLAKWADAPIFELTLENQESVRLHFLNQTIANQIKEWIAQ